MGEIILLIILAVVSLILFVNAQGFSVSFFDSSGGPAIYPQAVLIILVVFVIIRIIIVLRTKNYTYFVFTELFQGVRLVILLSSLALIVLLPVLGYIVSMSLFMIFIVHFLLYKTNGTIGSVSFVVLRIVILIAAPLLIYFFFANVLNVLLPKGRGILPF